MTWVTLANTLFGTDKPVRWDILKQQRDNLDAAMAGSSGSPVNTAVWHPYNRTAAGDANSGTFYDFAVDGALAAVASPNFADGYEYQIVMTNLSGSSFQMAMYQETTGAYTAYQAVLSATSVWDGLLQMPFVRAAVKQQTMFANAMPSSTMAANAFAYAMSTSAQKVTRVRFTIGAVTAGKMQLFRRQMQYTG